MIIIIFIYLLSFVPVSSASAKSLSFQRVLHFVSGS